MCGICARFGINLHDARDSQNGDLADAAGFNAGWNWQNGPGLPQIDQDFTFIRGNPVYDLTGDSDPNRLGVNNVFEQLDSGWLQDTSDGVITYAFYEHRAATGTRSGEGRGYTPFTEEQEAAARIAIQNWDDLIEAEFVEVDPSDSPGNSAWAQNEADIWLANTSTGPAQAWAYYPGYGQNYKRAAGDVWIADPNFNGSNAQLDPGFYGLHTLNHELGHSIGLSHPGNYDFGDDNDGDGVPDPITYEGDAFYFQDSHQYTIMSYFDSYETGAQPVDWNTMRLVYPSTPMVHDVAVAQAKYGADMETRDGDTTYGFNATSDVTNEALRFEEHDMLTVFTIWDGGGNDTLDLSGYYTDSVIDLRPGAYSSAGGWGAYDPALIGTEPTLDQINANNQLALLPNRSATLFDYYFKGVEGVNEGISWKEITGTGEDYLMEQNIGIAYGAIVENAVGGHGDDRINGNSADNRLTGGDGADTFIFAEDASVDTITDFESGVDTIDLSELGIGAADVTITGENIYAQTADQLVHIVTEDSQAQMSDFFFG